MGICFSSQRTNKVTEISNHITTQDTIKSKQIIPINYDSMSTPSSNKPKSSFHKNSIDENFRKSLNSVQASQSNSRRESPKHNNPIHSIPTSPIKKIPFCESCNRHFDNFLDYHNHIQVNYLLSLMLYYFESDFCLFLSI